MVKVGTARETETFSEAAKDPRWIEAMNEEMQALCKNETWDLLGMSKAVNAEEITQSICVEEEPAYGRCKTEYAQRERERERQRMSIFIKGQQLQMTTNLYKTLQSHFI